jgi:hypothetical protein
MIAVSRRDIILAGVAVALAAGVGCLPSSASTGTSMDRFITLSSRLTGTAAGDLDRDAGEALLAGFTAAGHGAALERLSVDHSSDPDLADAVVAAWYSGVVGTGTGDVVATFNAALVWNALSFTKPFANCGGETGYWSQPPAG